MQQASDSLLVAQSATSAPTAIALLLASPQRCPTTSAAGTAQCQARSRSRTGWLTVARRLLVAQSAPSEPTAIAVDAGSPQRRPTSPADTSWHEPSSSLTCSRDTAACGPPHYERAHCDRLPSRRPTASVLQHQLSTQVQRRLCASRAATACRAAFLAAPGLQHKIEAGRCSCQLPCAELQVLSGTAQSALLRRA